MVIFNFWSDYEFPVINPGPNIDYRGEKHPKYGSIGQIIHRCLSLFSKKIYNHFTSLLF